MSAYDPYDPPARTRYDDRRDRYGDPREVRESYVSRELVPRRHRDEDELTVERAYPAGYSSRDARRARSAEPGYYDDYYDRGSNYSSRRRGRRKDYADSYYESAENERRRRVLSRQEKIIAAVAGAALAVGGKEVYDRRAAHMADDDEVQRNYLHSAALGAAGAFVGYQGAGYYNKHAAKSEDKALVMHKGRDGRHRGVYSSDDDDDDPPAKKGHKKFLESALGVTSLGAALKALTGAGKDDDHDDRGSHRGRSRSRSSTRSRARSMNKAQKAAMAGLLAGATEAFRIAKEPGSFRGEKTKRMLTAALGAGVLGGAHGEDHNKRDIAQSVIGGLLGNRVVHGSRKNIEEDSRTGRSRSRSRFRSRSESAGPGGNHGGGLAALASAGLAALGAKKAMGSRDDDDDDSRGRGRSPSPDRRHRSRSRSRSMVDSARRSLAKLGIGDGPDDASEHGGSRSSRHRRRYSDESDDEYRRPSRREVGERRYRYDDGYKDDRSYRPRRSRRERSPVESDTDLGDSSDDERHARKMRGKQIITTGLATIASIHAAHGVYQSIEKRKSRRKAVKAGTMSPNQARALKSKAMLEDAASVGLAALGVKGAISELRQATQQSHECKLWKIEKKLRHDRRVERQRRIKDGYRRRRVENWESLSAPQPIRSRSLRHDEETCAETSPPSPR